jgi:hypothetical protein
VCAALLLVDFSATQLRSLGASAFDGCGITRIAIPASLQELDARAFDITPLKALDLRACGGIKVVAESMAISQLEELWLPLDGFTQAARAFLRWSRIEVIQADVDAERPNEFFPELDEWGFERLRVVSPRMPPYEWRSPRESLVAPLHLTDPMALSTAAAVRLTTWRAFATREAKFLRELDLSGLAVVSLPAHGLKDMAWLEKTVLPAGLRVLPEGLFENCSRLTSVDTSSCTALESIEKFACAGCRALRVFAFPPTLRVLSFPFRGTSITEIDLSGTNAGLADVRHALVGGVGAPSKMRPRRLHRVAIPSACYFRDSRRRRVVPRVAAVRGALRGHQGIRRFRAGGRVRACVRRGRE